MLQTFHPLKNHASGCLAPRRQGPLGRCMYGQLQVVRSRVMNYICLHSLPIPPSKAQQQHQHHASSHNTHTSLFPSSIVPPFTLYCWRGCLHLWRICFLPCFAQQQQRTPPPPPPPPRIYPLTAAVRSRLLGKSFALSLALFQPSSLSLSSCRAYLHLTTTARPAYYLIAHTSTTHSRAKVLEVMRHTGQTPRAR